MKRNLLFMIFCITTLTFLGCGKQKTPVMSNSVETEVETETITTDEIIAEEVEETIENVTEEIIEEIETTTEISEGVPFEEGEYSEPSVDILEQEEQEYSEVADAMEKAKKDMLEFYEAGIISKEDYEAAMEILNEGPHTGESMVSEYIPSTSDEAFAQQYEENAKKAREDDSSSLPLSDERTDINYDIDLPDEYKGR